MKYAIPILLLAMSSAHAQKYIIDSVDNTLDTRFKINENFRDIENNKLDITAASNTYVTKDEAVGSYLAKTDASSTYLTKDSATATYENYQQAMSSFGVADTRRAIFEPNGTNTGNIVFAYQRHELGTDGDDTFTNVTAATHHNLLFIAASVSLFDNSNSVGYDYSVANTNGFALFMDNSTDDFRVIYPASPTGLFYGSWINIVVCYTKTAY